MRCPHNELTNFPFFQGRRSTLFLRRPIIRLRNSLMTLPRNSSLWRAFLLSSPLRRTGSLYTEAWFKRYLAITVDLLSGSSKIIADKVQIRIVSGHLRQEAACPVVILESWLTVYRFRKFSANYFSKSSFNLAEPIVWRRGKKTFEAIFFLTWKYV